MLAISTFAVAVFLYWATIGFLQRQTDSTIEVEITGLREQYGLLGLNGLSRVIGDRILSGKDPEALYLFANRQLRPLAGNMNAWPDLVSRADGWYSFTNRIDGRDVPARARVLALPEGLLLLVGRDISDLDRLLGLAGAALAWGAGLVIVLSLVGGAFMSSRVLKRVESINETTRSIITGDLSQRVKTRGTRDEFDQLAANLNGMLDQIEQLMGGIQHVGDSIAHDLRTPLTRLRHSLEEAAASKDVGAMREQVQSAIDDADGLLATFSALLRIARIESGGYAIRTEPVDMSRLVQDALELYEVVADERTITVTRDLSNVPEINGDRDLIFQLIVNLLDNALKYTAPDGDLRVSVRHEASCIVLSVADTGCGIPEPELEKVTRRFYRVDSSRRHPGSGLGLSLVQVVADLHGATLSFANLSQGLRVDVAFPTAAHL
jgi:signal transduction histidine kinase